MSRTTAGVRALRAAGVPFEAHEYAHRVKGAAYAAEATGVEPERLAKTLVVEVDGSPVFALVPADAELGLRTLARAAGARNAALAAEREAERLTGYTVGGISPFGSRRKLPVYADRRWLAHDRVALNGGARGLIVELSREDLVRLVDPTEF